MSIAPKVRPPADNTRAAVIVGALLVAIVVLTVVIVKSGGSGTTGTPAGTSPSTLGTTPSSSSTTAAPTSSTSTTSTVPPSTFAPPSTVPLATTPVSPVCPPSGGGPKREVLFSKAPPDCIAKTSVWDATFETSLGNFTLQMAAAKSYAAVNNFVFLAGWHFYDGTFFHRIIPGFVVQGGDPTGTGTGGAGTGSGVLKQFGYPGYDFTGNTPPASCKTTPGPACYQPYDFALANRGTPTTNASQFFIVLPGGQTTLDQEPLYTDFGHIVSGTSVAARIGALGTSSGTPTVRVYVTKVVLSEVKS
ncbi:MAG TPA: peptidylprolyl isomerase [Acidimicrobiales bacterium]|nr:peptidylprolyl isomerase [Acidimicrobiales bacterium]